MTRSRLSSVLLLCGVVVLAVAGLLALASAEWVSSVLTDMEPAVVHAQGGGCGFECCGPMAVHLHAAAYALPDPQNEAPEVDIAWTPITTTVAEPHVPVRFRVTFCPRGVNCAANLTIFEGVIPVDRSTGGAAGVVPIGTWPDESRIGACGQENLSEPLRAIV